MGCIAQALRSGHCGPVGLRALAQDQRHSAISQTWDWVSLAEDKGPGGCQGKCPFSQRPCPCTGSGWSPLGGGLVSERHRGVHVQQGHAGAPLLTDTWTYSFDTVKEAGADERGREALVAPFLTQPSQWSDPRPVGAHDRGIRHGPGKIMLLFVALQTRLPWPFLPPPPSLKTGLLWPFHFGSRGQPGGLPQPGEGHKSVYSDVAWLTGQPGFVPWGLFIPGLAGKSQAHLPDGTITMGVCVTIFSNRRTVAIGHPGGTCCALMSPWRPMMTLPDIL